MTTLVLPKFPQSPMFIDIERQRMSREWLNFLLSLSLRVGGPLTGDRLMATDENGNLVSVEDLTAWISGPSVSDDGDGTVTVAPLDDPDLQAFIYFIGMGG